MLIFISTALLTGQGCVSTKKQGSSGPPDAAIWISTDKGETWEQSALMPTLQGVKNLGDLSVNLLLFDPQDPETLYWGAGDAGLFVSYDGGRSWQEVKKLIKTQINDVAVDAKNHNVIYVSIGNRIFKTTDCCRNWKNIYLDVPGVAINALAIDPTNSARILAGLADGRLIKSEDGGLNWSLFYNFKTNIRDIMYNLKEPRIIYVGMQTEGIFRSADGGATWAKNEALEKINGGKIFYYGFFDETQKDGLYILTDAGFLRSNEGATNWQEYKLLTPPGRVKVLAFTVNPKNPNEVYYATDTTFYKSNSAGVTWITKNLPTTSRPTYLTTHPQNPKILYLGTMKVQKKK